MPVPPRVDAVIPVFNAPAAGLEAAVGSCLASPLIGRVIVVDDGSEPPASIRDGQVDLIRQANAGPSAARNTGLDRTAAEFVLLLDHDDRLEAGVLSEALTLADRLGAAAVVSARYESLAGGERRLKGVPGAWVGRLLPAPGEVFRPLAIFGASGLLIRRTVIEAGLRFDPGLWIGEDRDFLRRLADVGPIAVSGAPLLTVAIHRDGTNLSSPAHLARRVRDHLTILGRHARGDAAAPLREQTRWLLNTLSRQRAGAFDGRAWDELAAAARARGWPVPVKSRLRAMARRLLSHAR